MSAWQLNSTHIAAVAASFVVRSEEQIRKDLPDWLTDAIDDEDRVKDTKLIAAVLASENAKSVNYRYNAAWEPVEVSEALIRHFLASPLTDTQFHTAVSCYDYQACEHPSYGTSKAFEYVSAMLDMIPQAAKDAPTESDYWGMEEAGSITTAMNMGGQA